MSIYLLYTIMKTIAIEQLFSFLSWHLSRLFIYWNILNVKWVYSMLFVMSSESMADCKSSSKSRSYSSDEFNSSAISSRFDRPLQLKWEKISLQWHLMTTYAYYK